MKFLIKKLCLPRREGGVIHKTEVNLISKFENNIKLAVFF
jgi:hypothetical protein